MLEMLVESFVGRLDANLTCVGNGEDALDVEMIEPHDVVVTELALPGLDGLTLAKHLMELSDRPVILLAEEPALSHAVEAMRLRAWDLFAKPFAIKLFIVRIGCIIFRPLGVIPGMPGSVSRDANSEPFFTGRFDDLGCGILFRSHLCCIESIDNLGIPHGKTVVMDGHGDNVFRPCVIE